MMGIAGDITEVKSCRSLKYTWTFLREHSWLPPIQPSIPLILMPKFRNEKGSSTSTPSYFQIREVIYPNLSLPCTPQTCCSTLLGVSVVRHELLFFEKARKWFEVGS